MKKLALAIGFVAYVVFGASSALAAFRVDYGAGVATNRESRVWSETATNARLLFLNEALYPETTVKSETAPNARLLAINEALYPETTAPGYSAVVAHGEQERADMAQPDTSRTDTLRMICGDDLCLEP